ncbi:hypothetical protein [Roseibacillus ishigakijimensis]|uniref:Uncharacterized protein n=1 Tax=Roseibacillus ishigakijimensis TaxID=454146 RepID=A0A934RS58_9BACT|nr:hypothetical protein [Roseibacillus ishigakijimensis]MBK1833526.1 hypothetical protein [Roseibacillus ishigakijimensis]
MREVLADCGLSWGREGHGLALASALACYEGAFGQIVIPSTFAYRDLKFPWGSCPVTNHFWSSEEREWWHDGAAQNKLGKVRVLAKSPAACDLLRVCWEGEDKGKNCGTCFKCVATQICFWLSGVPRPGAFGEGCDLQTVRDTYLKGSTQNRGLFAEFAREARRQGMTELARECEKALSRQFLNRKLRKIRLWRGGKK